VALLVSWWLGLVLLAGLAPVFALWPRKPKDHATAELHARAHQD
jgi:hypothetical protein